MQKNRIQKKPNSSMLQSSWQTAKQNSNEFLLASPTCSQDFLNFHLTNLNIIRRLYFSFLDKRRIQQIESLMKVALISALLLCTLSTSFPENIIKGSNNFIKGSGNVVDGENNQLFGFSNVLNGFDNVALVSDSDIRGDGNWLVGTGLNLKGSGLVMFGPNTSPEIRARWKKLNF